MGSSLNTRNRCTMLYGTSYIHGGQEGVHQEAAGSQEWIEGTLCRFLNNCSRMASFTSSCVDCGVVMPSGKSLQTPHTHIQDTKRTSFGTHGLERTSTTVHPPTDDASTGKYHGKGSRTATESDTAGECYTPRLHHRPLLQRGSEVTQA